MSILVGADAPDPDADLEAALTRFLVTKSVPQYLRTPAEQWLAEKEDHRV